MEKVENTNVGDVTKNSKATTGLVLGIIGLVAWFIPIIGAPVTITGLTFSIKGLKSLKRNIATVAIVLCSFGLLLSIGNAALGAYLAVTGKHPIVNFFNKSGDAGNDTQKAPSGSLDATKQAFIERIIEEVKLDMPLPRKIDDVTMLVDVTAEPGAVRYHYTSSGIDTSKVTNDLLKGVLVSGICKNDQTKNLLSQGVNLEFEYSVEDSTKKFFVTITKADCE